MGSRSGVDIRQQPDPEFARFFSIDLLRRVGPGVFLTSYQLGDPGFGGFVYPAAGDLTALFDGSYWLPGNPYDNSVAQGRHELVAYLTDRATACPGEVFVLGGWSQGAQVIGEGLKDLPRAVRDRIADVALFGDPTFQTGNSIGPFPISFPVACALGPRPWMRGSAPCWIKGGFFGPRDPYLPADMELRVGSWCREFDAPCTGGFADIAGTIAGVHQQYFDPDSDSAMAAREAALALQIFLPARAASFDASWFQFVTGATGADLAIVFDTTGSMWGAIDDAKAQASELAQRWLDFFPNGRVGLIDFKDQGDPYVARIDLGLTSNIADFQTAVNGLSASGGGDTPEAQLSGVMTALDGLDWRNGATKAEIVITDAPGKDPEPITGYTRDQAAQRAREIDPVAIYGVNVSGSSDVSDFMAPLAAGTAGQVLVLQPGQSLADALFTVLDTVHYSPVAKLNGPYIAQTGTPIRFRTDGSFDADAQLVSYAWDFDGNGTVDQTTSTPTVQHAYPAEFHGLATVRVVSSDGGSAIATAQVTVDSIGLGNLLPAAPASVSASITGPNEATATWAPAANDRADGYEVFRSDGTPVGLRLAGDPYSVVVSGLDLSQPVVFKVVASNRYGNSAAVAASLNTTTYTFDGFRQPINDTAHAQTCGSPCPVSVFKAGSTVPVKFQLKDANGAVVQSATLPIWATPVQGGATTAPIDESVYSGPATSGNAFRWDGTQYVYNWSTKGLAPGFYYRITAILDDRTRKSVYIGLR